MGDVAPTTELALHLATYRARGDINAVVLEIASGAEGQATDLKEINAAVGEMDKGTQQNAAMAEQATAVSHTLAEESDRLTNLVAVTTVRTSVSGQVIQHRSTILHTSFPGLLAEYGVLLTVTAMRAAALPAAIT